MQEHSSWAAVAGAALGAAVGAAANEVFGGKDGLFSSISDPRLGAFAVRTLSGTLGSAAGQFVESGRVNWASAFGSGLGNSLVDAMSQPSAQQIALSAAQSDAIQAKRLQENFIGYGAGDFARLDGAGYRNNPYAEPVGAGGYAPSGRSYQFGELGSGTFGLDLPISDQVRAMAAEAEGGRILTQMRDAEIDANRP